MVDSQEIKKNKKAPESTCSFFWGHATVLVDKLLNRSEYLFTYLLPPVKDFSEIFSEDRKTKSKNFLRQRVKTGGKRRLVSPRVTSETESQTALWVTGCKKDIRLPFSLKDSSRVWTEHQMRCCIRAKRLIKVDLRQFVSICSQRISTWDESFIRLAGESKNKPGAVSSIGINGRVPISYRCVLKSGKGLHPFDPGAVRPSRPNPLHSEN